VRPVHEIDRWTPPVAGVGAGPDLDGTIEAAAAFVPVGVPSDV
jgi:hypothetical protein